MTATCPDASEFCITKKQQLLTSILVLDSEENKCYVQLEVKTRTSLSGSKPWFWALQMNKSKRKTNNGKKLFSPQPNKHLLVLAAHHHFFFLCSLCQSSVVQMDSEPKHEINQAKRNHNFPSHCVSPCSHMNTSTGTGETTKRDKWDEVGIGGYFLGNWHFCSLYLATKIQTAMENGCLPLPLSFPVVGCFSFVLTTQFWMYLHL